MEPQVYSPGAGHAPISDGLPGRSIMRAQWHDNLEQLDLRGRRLSIDPVITGLRGTGKTVLLERLRLDSRATGFHTIALQATRSQGIWSELAARLDRLTQERRESFWATSLAALRRINGIEVAGVKVGFDATAPAAHPLGRSGSHLAATLRDLSQGIRENNGGRGGLVITIDELQSAPPDDIELLGAALHQLNQDEFREARVAIIGAALPSIHDALVGRDPDEPLITHPERLFTMHELPSTLDEQAAALALLEPARTLDGGWADDAIARVISLSDGYPAHLQHIAAATWAASPTPHIDTEHVEAALPEAAAAIEVNYLQPRWNRLRDRQHEYLTALGIAGGTASARQLQTILGRDSSKQLSMVREALIKRGEIYAPAAGQVSLAMPLMGPYAIAAYPPTRNRSARRDDLLSLTAMKANNDGWVETTTTDAALPSAGKTTLDALTARRQPPRHQSTPG